MTTSHAHEIGNEMAAASFADARLRKRLGVIAEKLSLNPELSFPKVFTDAELEAAYRFFGNAVVTPDGILSGHFEATTRRCIDEGTVLVLHDTTKFSFRVDGQRKG